LTDSPLVTRVDAYSASKAALHHLTRVLASQLPKRAPITCNALLPGPFPSKMMNATLEKFHDVIVSGIPLGRVGIAEDIAGACLYLSSRAGNYITGALLPVDGGTLVSAKL
jgi:NAD(P)-dependent dehydrogenase (short-subunit alcohol dehydrogenase family)